MKLDIIDSFNEIYQVLRRNKARTLLTAFGIFWGIFMLLFLVGGGQGLKALLLENFDGFAANASVVGSNNTTRAWKGYRQNRYWSIEHKDIDRLKTMIPELEVVTPMVSRWGNEAVYDTKIADRVILKGAEPDFIKIEAPEMLYGRYLNESDIIQERKVCVIGKTIYTSLFPEGGDPCGKFIQVGSVNYQVIGVNMRVSNMNINGSADRSCYVPLPIVQKLYNTGSNVDMLCVTAKAGISTASLETKVRSILARSHNFDPDDKPAMLFLNLGDFFAVVDNLMNGVDLLILLIGIGTILAGAIGVSNIMMVTVKERTIEIGIRRAIGAKPSDVLSQIIIETVTITTVAGSLGIVFAVRMLQLLENIVNKGITFQIDITTALTALAFIAVLGVLAGLAPARRAMKIKAVDAMRDE